MMRGACQDGNCTFNVTKQCVRELPPDECPHRPLLDDEEPSHEEEEPRESPADERDAEEDGSYRVSLSAPVLQALDEFRRFSGNHEDFIAYNRAFHSALAHASGNRRMAAALCDLIGQADRLVRVSVANVRDHDPTQLVAEHVALIEAMQRRDGRTAARLIKAHITQTEKRVLPALKRNAVIVEA